MKIEGKEYVDATKMSLSDWLSLLTPENKEKFAFTYWSFPTDSMKKEYLESIKNRSENEVIDLLRNFLIPSGSLGSDDYSLKWLTHCLEHDKETFKKLMETEFYKRLLRASLDKETTVWEGNTWIIDLLPHHPKEALEALEAYFLGHIQHLPDGRWDGLQDAITLVRAKFIQTPTSALLTTLDPYQLEHLIDSLYSKMGYETTLTRRTYDGGRDIIAVKGTAGEKEKLLIQCKKKKRNVGVGIARELLGVVSDEKANKGVLVSSTGFTSSAKKLQQSNPRLELIGNTELQFLLNTHFSPTWPKMIDYIITQSMKKFRET